MPRKERTDRYYRCGHCSKTTTGTHRLLCSTCGKWMHTRCLQMDREKRTEWSTSNLSFTCQACAFNNRPGQAMHRRYNARAALSRLETAFNSGESAMCDAAKSERLLLQTYGITLPPSKPGPPTGPVDDISQIILQQYDPTVLESYQPLALAPDGNCFYRGLSRALYSHENCHLLLRVLVVLEMVEHRSYYDKRAPDFVDLINDGTLVEAEYNRELGRAVRHSHSASFVNMLAGSAVLQLTYKSYCPHTVSPRHISIPYTRLVRGRGVLTDRPAFTLMWTMCAIPPTHADFQPNHFNVLRSNSEAHQRDEWSSLGSSMPPTLSPMSPPCSTAPSPASTPMPPPSSVAHQRDELSSLPASSPMPQPSSVAHQRDELSSLPASSPMPQPSSAAHQRGELSSLPPPSTTTPPHSTTPSVRAIGGKDLPGPQRDFLDVDTLVHELRACNEPQEHIPRGVKENVYFLVNNSENEDRHLAGKRSEYWDDCGAWSSRSSGVITHFLSQPGEKLKTIVLHDGLYCLKKQLNKKPKFIPVEPQPQQDSVVVLHRYYLRLSRDLGYEKRVSWIEGDSMQIVCIEYKGSYSGDAPHGNSKTESTYVRLRPDVAAKVKDSVKTQRPQEIYRQIKDSARETGDSAEAPRNSKQIRNARYTARKTDRPEGYRGNLADHVQALENRVLYDPFVQRVSSGKNVVPTIICYTKEQMSDVKKFCCAGATGVNTVLAFDKTYNLGQLHVTVSVFKHLAVIRKDSKDNPIFAGPILIHGNSDFMTYADFFCHISNKLMALDAECHPVVGSDDELAMRKAIAAAFSQGSRISCVRHLRNNVGDYLRDTVGMDVQEREGILEPLFGSNGLTSATNERIFDGLLHQARQTASEYPLYHRYFQRRVEPMLLENFRASQLPGFHQPLNRWTNNNCESLNHVLKQAINWHPQALGSLIDTIHSVVRSQYTELERCLQGVGDYLLCQDFQQFRVHEVAWMRMTNEERERHFSQFMRHTISGIPQSVTSTDGTRVITRPTNGGKKPGQVKRKRAARTTTMKRTKT